MSGASGVARICDTDAVIDPLPDRVAARVEVWHAHVDHAWHQPDRALRAGEWLAPEERARFARFHFDVDRQMFLLGRVMARVLVGRALGCAPLAWQWRQSSRGRPEIGYPPTTVRFNLSHSAGLVVCAIAADRDVGVDVEHLQRRATDPAIVDRYCAPAEAEAIAAPHDGWRDRFLTYWTLKEAYLKARGLGISVPLAEVAFDLTHDRPAVRFHGSLAGSDTAWRFALASFDQRHLLAVAVPAADDAPVDVAIEPFPAAWLP